VTSATLVDPLPRHAAPLTLSLLTPSK